MTSPRILGFDAVVVGRSYPLDRETEHRLCRVLRHRNGDRLCVCDATGREFEAILRPGRPRKIEVLAERPAMPSADYPLILCQAVPKGDKMETILRGTTELGITAIFPFFARRSIPQIPPDRMPQKLRRWRKVALEAARLCRRPDVPPVSEILSLEGALSAAGPAAWKYVLWEEAGGGSLKEALREATTPERGVAVVVGPEGGFEREEVQLAISRGFRPVHLGRRVLRVETAAVAALAILQYESGGLDIPPGRELL